MHHYSRLIEQDLLPLTQRLNVEFSAAVGRAAAESGRPTYDVAKAAFIALAASAAGLRDMFDIPIEAWAEANLIATTHSLSADADALPATRDRMHAVKASNRRPQGTK